ncbi:response regulator [Pseudomonas sp. CM25]|uniref:response regulator n=1 Tax=Pseudomonas sp. CM25 TaxID=2738448 RepID=UPI0015534E38|nr:response regulator [Pseudomonas sp. CM25]NQD58787.1 response regulator [Pseudomonas sp. CM25]
MRGHILIVEDDDLLRDLTAESLTSLYAQQVTVCANADEALCLLSEGLHAALVFTDIHMPGALDGLDLAREIWTRWPEVPVILTSGHTVVPVNALPANAAFLPKPWTIADLAQLISKLLPDRDRLG